MNRRQEMKDGLPVTDIKDVTGVESDPLAVEVDLTPHIQAQLGRLMFAGVTSDATKATLEAKAREVIDQQAATIADLQAKLAKYETETG